MSSFSGDLTPAGRPARTASLTDADRALLLAAAAWGDRCRRPTETTAARRHRAWISSPASAIGSPRPGSEGFAVLWIDDVPLAGSSDRVQALDELRRMHRATARVDLGRVHPSWWVRALREESPAVQRLVTASLAGFAARSCCRPVFCSIQRTWSVSERPPPRSRAGSWLSGPNVWSAARPSGPTTRPPSSCSPACRPALVIAFAGWRGFVNSFWPASRRAAPPARASVRAGNGSLAAWRTPMRTCGRWPARDVETSRSSKLPPRQQAARIGLATIARLLADSRAVSPALGPATLALPYRQADPIVDAARHEPARSYSCNAETWILKTAWDRLNLEGRLALAWPESYVVL